MLLASSAVKNIFLEVLENVTEDNKEQVCEYLVQ